MASPRDVGKFEVDQRQDTGPRRPLFPDDDVPEGAVVDAGLPGKTIVLDADFVVVGTGAAGAVAGHALAQAGYGVVLVEEGPWVKTRDFRPEVGHALHTLMRDGGAQVIAGRSMIPLLQGRCVGGSTVVNSAITWRVPEDVLDDWSRQYGLGDGISMRALEPHYDALERELHARVVAPETLGDNARLFLSAASEGPLAATAMRRYERDCQGSGRCLTGCPTAAKQAMNVTCVPWALRNGARLVVRCQVQRVAVAGGRAVGVWGQGTGEGEAARRVVDVRARMGVVVAASTVQSPVLLRRSGLRAKALGHHFQAHPGVGLGGIFETPVNMVRGATQAAEAFGYRASAGFKPETLTMQPELAAVRMPGLGAALVQRLGWYSHAAVWVAQTRARAQGTVKEGWLGGTRVQYSLGESDVAIARNACGVLARLLFEAGAREVWPGIHGVPAVLQSMDDVRHIDAGPLDPRAYAFVATHLFGAARMGRDVGASVVGTDFESHEVERLYVVDSSVFPTNLGVNPQHTIMAMARLAAFGIAERGLRRAA